MSTQAQLEIISPGGETEWHSLDTGKGVANIGRHPDNDIVIDAPGVAPFHALLDCQQRPFQIMLLTDEGQTKLRGEPLPANTFKDLDNWDTVEIDGYSIILLEGEAVTAEVAPAAVVPLAVPVSMPEPIAVSAPPPGQLPVGALLPDLTDDVIITEMAMREWTVDVEQTATFQLTLTNGGDIVAAFDIQVEGIDQSWLTVTPAELNLNERATATVNVSITPPRQTTSRAGTHPLAIVITSPNHPGRISRMGAVLIVNPYYEFFVGELSPREQTVSWFRRTGLVTLPVGNRGNSETALRLDAEDDERGLRFEFEVPGEEALLVKQAEMRMTPDESYFVPVQITPMKRRFIALRSRQFSFTITASMVEGALTPRSVMGRTKARPLIGPLLLLLLFVGLASLSVFFFRPIAEPVLLVSPTAQENEQPMASSSDERRLASLYPRIALDHEAVVVQAASEPAQALSKATLQVEDPITFSYDARRFPSLSPNNLLNHQNAFFLRLTLEFKSTQGGTWQVARAPSELAKPVGSVTVIPLQNGRYRLRAESWISQLLPMFAGVSREVPVFVTPLEPVIEEFSALVNPVWAGEEAVLFWQVAGAEILKIEYNGIIETLQDSEIESGQRAYALDGTTTFNLIASNSSWPEPVQKPLEVGVLVPTPTPIPTTTPIPTPVILRFDVDPLEITVGETVRIDWEVTGADSVSIDPVDQGLPIKGNIGAQPQTLTTYQLNAFKIGENGAQVQNSSQLREVIVNPEPTATAVPVAPEVQIFEVIPKEIIRTVTDTVKLTWSVSGHTTNIEITGPEITIGGLKEQDVITVTVKETSLLVLTAYNGDLSRSAAVEVTVLEPTPTPTPTPVPTEPPPPTPEPTPTPTPTPVPPPLISYYKAEGVQGSESKVVFQRTDDGVNGPVHLYQVEAGARVNLSWGVKDADTVILGSLGTQPAEGSIDLPEPVVQATTHMLTAENNGGQNVVNAFIQLNVVSPPAPPAPPHVSGVEDPGAGTIKIMWSYRTEDRARIDGFRIYRADVPPGDSFVPAWTEYDPNASEWTDSVGETCGKAYYVVAVYTDLVNNVERETAASATSWYSQACP